MVRTTRKIPIGWEHCEPIGSLISGTKIFAFKTPLLPELQKKFSKTNRFTTVDLLRMISSKGDSIGLIINCSNTKRYYNSKDIEDMNIVYREILCPGRGFLLRNDLTKDFNNVIDEFLSQNKDNNLLIGVHCGDGINRAGYLICNYLICKMGWTSHDALNAFESARGYSIQRGSYIQALHKADSDRRRSENQPSYAISKINQRDVHEPNINGEKALSEDTQMTPQVMQQLFQLGQQFKQITESSIIEPSLLANTALSSMNNYSAGAASSSFQKEDQFQTQVHSYNTDYQETAEGDFISDEEDEANDDDSSPNIDYESMGRVDMKEPLSKSASRRKRRQKREKIFNVMKKGRLWEINEARNQMK